jgi:RNase P/RNase MRP subunit POP5
MRSEGHTTLPPPTHAFLETTLVLSGGPKQTQTVFDRKLVKSIIVQATRGLFGVVGSAAWTVDVVDWNAQSRRAVLRVPADALVRVRAALTLFRSFRGEPCRFDVDRASADLRSLACERHLRFEPDGSGGLVVAP